MTEEQKQAAINIYKFYYRDLKWCGCGNPEGAMRLMRQVLDAIRWKSEEGRDKPYEEYEEKLEALVGGFESPLSLTYFYTLDAADLIEHGGGVQGGWLSPKGKWLLSQLTVVGNEEWDSENISAEVYKLDNSCN